MQNEKILLRKQFKKIMADATTAVDSAKLIDLAKPLISSGVWAVYDGLPGEVSPADLVSHFNEVSWAYPRIIGDDLEFYIVSGPEGFERNEKWKMLEPIPENCELVPFERIDGVIIPGLAFDRGGRRLGRGKGYYDRVLKKCPNAKKIGLAFSHQIYEGCLPTQDHDIDLDFVLTDVELIVARRESNE